MAWLVEFCKQPVAMEHASVVFESYSCPVAMAVVFLGKAKVCFAGVFLSFIGFYWNVEKIEIVFISTYILLLLSLKRI